MRGRPRAFSDTLSSVFTDQIEQQDLPKQDPEYVDLLRRVLAIQADCEIGGPHLYVDAMLPSAPTQIDQLVVARDRKSTRLNSSHGKSSYAVFCLKKKKKKDSCFRCMNINMSSIQNLHRSEES